MRSERNVLPFWAIRSSFLQSNTPPYFCIPDILLAEQIKKPVSQMHMFEYEWWRKLDTCMKQNTNKHSNLDRFHTQHCSIFCIYGFVLGVNLVILKSHSTIPSFSFIGFSLLRYFNGHPGCNNEIPCTEINASLNILNVDIWRFITNLIHCFPLLKKSMVCN